MGTYKHIGRLRSARLVGREVASFYMLLGEVQKTAAFLTDALRTFEQDGWRELVAQTQIELAECYKKSGDLRKYVRTCAAVCAAPEIDNLIRWSYFDEMKKHLELIEKTIVVPFKDIIRVVSVSHKNKGVIMQDTNIDVELQIESNFPREVLCSDIIISLETESKEHSKKSKDRFVTEITSKDLKPQNNSLRKLRIQKRLDYKEDKQLACASVAACLSTTVKRADSTTPNHRSDFNTFLETNKTVS